MSSSTPTSNQTAPGVEPALAAELLDIVDGTARLDERHRQKQPDWTYDAVYSGQSPADRFDDHRDGSSPPLAATARRT